MTEKLTKSKKGSKAGHKTKSEEESHREEFDRLGEKIVAEEHAQMPKVCPFCGGDMGFAKQMLIEDPEPGDKLIYRCKDCGETVEKFFQFPKEYAKFWKGETKFKPNYNYPRDFADVP